MKTILMSVALAALVLAAPVFAGAPAKGPLDGKSYAVVVKMPDGTTKDNTLAFKEGKLECALSKAAGYEAAKYTAKTEGTLTTVSAELKNAKGDVRKIAGTITGDKMSGTIDVMEAGKSSKLTFAPKTQTPAIPKSPPTQ